MVGAAYGALRLSRGLLSTSSEDPYHSGIGTHVVKNLGAMIRYTGRFGMHRGEGTTEALVLGMVVAAKVVDDRHWINTFQARTDVMTRDARRYPVVGNTVVVEGACPIDATATRDGAMFRVVLDEPDLRVRFEAGPAERRARSC